MNNNLFSKKKQQFNDENGSLAGSAGFVGARRTTAQPYLTNTDKVPSTGAFAPVVVKVSEEEFREKSLQLFNEVKDLFIHDAKALRQRCAIGAERFRLINDDTLVIYRNFNRLGNSRAGYALASENSDEDKARFASKQLAQERALANVDIWAYFATLTFDQAKQDRHNFGPLLKRVTKWLRARKVKYYIVPELHKAGGIHFHMLLSAELAPHLSEFKDTAPKALNNTYIKTCLAHGRHVMNCAGLADNYGYNIVEPVRDAERCVLYLTKYVLKTFDNENFQRISRRRFFISQGLKSPKIILPHQIDLENFDLVALSSHTEKIYLKRADYRIRKTSLASMASPAPRAPAPPFSIKPDMNEQALPQPSVIKRVERLGFPLNRV